MKRLFQSLLSPGKYLLVPPAVLLLSVLAWAAVTYRTVAIILFVAIWFAHLALGAGAGYAALRLWHSRHHPLIKWMGLYINGFIIDALGSIVLLFMIKGVKLTWGFTAVLFISTLLGDIVRAPLIMYLIKGPTKAPLPLPREPETSGEMPKEYWGQMFQEIKEEIAALREEVAELKHESKANGI